MDALLDNLFRSPRLVQYRDRIEQVLRREHERRQRFYDRLTEDSRCEFINGETVLHSPAQHQHNSIVRRLLKVLDTHVSMNGLGLAGSEKYLISLTRNDYEPDICFWPSSIANGFSPQQMQFPAPRLVVEVLSPSTAVNDRGVKFEDYAAHGIDEYWIIDPDTSTVEQYVLRDAEYVLNMKTTSGVLRSAAVGGFEIPIAAIFDDDQNLAALREMLDKRR